MKKREWIILAIIIVINSIFLYYLDKRNEYLVVKKVRLQVLQEIRSKASGCVGPLIILKIDDKGFEAGCFVIEDLNQELL